MPLVQAGKTFTKDDLKRTAGDLSTTLRNAVQAGVDFRVQLESFPDADLVTLGLTQEEINAIKGFYVGDLPTIETALRSSQWVKQLLGLGV